MCTPVCYMRGMNITYTHIFIYKYKYVYVRRYVCLRASVACCVVLPLLSRFIYSGASRCTDAHTRDCIRTAETLAHAYIRLHACVYMCMHTPTYDMHATLYKYIRKTCLQPHNRYFLASKAPTTCININTHIHRYNFKYVQASYWNRFLQLHLSIYIYFLNKLSLAFLCSVYFGSICFFFVFVANVRFVVIYLCFIHYYY